VPEPESLAVIVRLRLVIVPEVTVGVPPWPPALPSATTRSPSLTALEFPTWMVFSPDAPTSFSSATSWVSSQPTICAG